MAGTQQILNYLAPHVDGSRFLKQKHVTTTLLRKICDETVNKISLSHGIQYNEYDILIDGPNWMGRRMEQVIAKFPHCVNAITFAVKNEKDANKLGSCSFYPDNGETKPVITISERCTSKAVLRAIILHEFVEMFICVMWVYGHTETDSVSHPHNTTCRIVDLYLAEKPEERSARWKNVVRCYLQLTYIAEQLAEIQKKRIIIDPIFFSDILAVGKIIRNKFYIPGYFEDYTPSGYIQESKSNIGKLFTRAAGMGIRYDQQTFNGRYTLKGDSGELTITLP